MVKKSPSRAPEPSWGPWQKIEAPGAGKGGTDTAQEEWDPTKDSPKTAGKYRKWKKPGCSLRRAGAALIYI